MSSLIQILASHFIPLSDEILVEAYEWSVEACGDTRDLLSNDIGDALIAVVCASSSS